jgi:hypothetical protein
MSISVGLPDVKKSGPDPVPGDGLFFHAPLALFLVIHFILRLVISPSLFSDDADLIIFQQSLAWGYSEQPPLYSWLFWLIALPLGPNLLSLTLLRSLILGAICWGVYLSGQAIWEDRRLARLAAFSLLLVPLLAWHALTYLTHSLLMTAVCAFTFFVAVRLVQRGRTWDYIWLGLCVALGLLSKYNFVFFAASLLAAGLTVPAVRWRLLDWRIGLSVLVSAVLILPHALWVYQFLHLLRLSYADKTVTYTEFLLWGIIPRGCLELVINLGIHASVLVAAFFVFFPAAFRRAPAGDRSERLYSQWTARYFWALAGLHLVYTLVTQANRMHERWLEPYFILLPVCLFGRLAGLAIPRFRLTCFVWLLLLFALGLTVGRGGQVWFGGGSRGYNDIDYDFRPVIPVVEENLAKDGVVVVDSRGLGGNLRQHLPHLHCVCLYHFVYAPPKVDRAGNYILMWDTQIVGSELPGFLKNYAEVRLGLTGVADVASRYVEIPSQFPNRQPRHFGYIVLPAKR